MRIWLSIVVVSVANVLMKASAPLAIGARPLPGVAVRVTALTAPVLLAALIVTDLGGEGWGELDGTQVAGVATAGAARLAQAPMLLAVLGGIAATASLRLLLGS